MFSQLTPDTSSLVNSEPASSSGSVLDWIDSWTYVRQDIQKLLMTYANADGGHDISSFLPQIEEADTALRLLRHRVEWLRNHLGYVQTPLIDRP